MPESVRLRVEGAVAVITLDRPARRNALDEEMWRQLGERTDEAAAARPRALVVTGAGPHFSAGMDLRPDNPLLPRLQPALYDGDEAAARAVIQDLKAILARLWTFPAPTIAAIEGACVGGGFEVALACDMRVAARSARVGLPEVRHGLVADLGGITRLTRLVGVGRAATVLLTGRSFDGLSAAELGLVEIVADTGGAFDRALALAAEIARNAPIAVGATLAALRDVAGLPLAAALDRETEAGVATLVGGEAIEGLMAFAAGRPPRWVCEDDPDATPRAGG